jgi:xanthine/CO dehydrogenase XdhC/CoxF family maturation factor
MKELLHILATLDAHPDGPAALATLVTVEGSSYRRPGARLLLLGDGTRIGSISGGCLEDDLLEHVRRTLADGQPRTIRYDTTKENDLVWGVGLGCQGVVQVAVERLGPRPAWTEALRANFQARRATALAVVFGETAGAAAGTHLAEKLPPLPAGAHVYQETVAAPVPLVVFGAGEDARPLVRLGRELGWHVTVVDSRAGHATLARFPEADAVIVAAPEEAAVRVPLDTRTFAVVMTHRYRDDVPLLRTLLPLPLAYLGLLGPKKRTERILAELATSGFVVTPEMRARLHAPVGLDLGATTPEGVALCMAAEIHARLSGRTPIHLRDRTGPIHG